MKKILLTSVLLLSGCATTKYPDYLQMAMSTGNGYQTPFTQEKYILTDYGAYIDKGLKVDKSIIHYKAFYDLRNKKSEIVKYFNNSEVVKDNYPAFVKQEGEVNCDTNANIFTETKLLDDFKTEKASYVLKEPTELSKSICIYKISIE